MRAGVVSEKPDAASQVAVGDAGRAKHQMLALDEIVHRQHLRQIANSHLVRAPGFLFIARLEPPHEHPAQTFERRRRQHALRRAPRAERNVDPRSGNRGRDTRIDVAVGD